MNNYHERPRSLKEKANIPCLKCDKSFLSQDRISIRICPACKEGKAWKGSRVVDALLPPPGRIMSIQTNAQAGMERSQRSASFGRTTRKRKKA